ncbi:FERM, ARHGEF and pleckstrin domain-containing protein 2 [Talpa occidentalis]|uniref:FERM, ARHGEF and pleckstrin domain-containing protein 2 n=1 Tax=Talpa occidentalis TaxID=50954 RepID=UPI00188EA608|nr:FERM, ARHGEF and pleckstrin domain-containing protein 2 [Talpa occidentalis]
MGDTAGTYRALPPKPGTPLGAHTLEPRAPHERERRLLLSVQLLDGSVETFGVEPKGCGQALLTQVWKRLNLAEGEYFGLELQDARGSWVWLEPGKPVARQVRRLKNAMLRLAVKFFPPDPGQLQEEHTRYLFALQLKRDLLEGRLVCSDTTAALLTSHLLQAEIGDYNEALDRAHLRANAYLPGQERALETVLEFHRRLAGQTPAESDFQVLEIARKLAMYGVRLHAASDREGARIHLAVAHAGILVFQNTTKINTFNWARVRKLSFKRRRFLVKLHPEVQGPHQDTLEFLLGSRDACKNFWKACVEHHSFFRLCEQPQPRARVVLFSRGSSFRYSGRTQKQLVDRVRDAGAKRAPHERRRSRTRTPVPAPTAEVPRQSMLLTEGATPAPPSSASSPFCAAPAGQPSLTDVGGPLPKPGALPTLGRPAAERSPGAGGPDGGCAPPAPSHGVRACLEPGGGPRGPAGWQASGPVGSSPAEGAPRGGQAGRGLGPAVMLTLQVLEEFIDDDPADIAFHAGAFPAPLGRSRPRGPPSRPSPDPGSSEAGSESEEEGAFGGGMHPADTAELLEVKARASLMHSLLGPSETSSLGNNGSRASSLSTLPLPGGLSAHSPSSAAPSEASSTAARPACSVHSQCSCAIPFCDVLDQLEQLSRPPAAAEDSSSPDSDSWGAEAESPQHVSLFLGGPFAQTSGEAVAFDFQSKLKSLTAGEGPEQSPS